MGVRGLFVLTRVGLVGMGSLLVLTRVGLVGVRSRLAGLGKRVEGKRIKVKAHQLLELLLLSEIYTWCQCIC